MTTALCGFYGYHNYGDTLMLNELTNFLEKIGIQAIAYSDRQAEEGEITVNHYDNLNTSDYSMIALGGGGIISDSFWFFKKKLYENLDRPLILFNVGLTTEAIPVFEKVKDKIKLLVVRDKFSFNLASKYYPGKVIHAPDISFLKKDGLSYPKSFNNNILVCLNYYIFKNYFSQLNRERIFAEKAIIEISSFLNSLTNKGSTISLIPCQTDGEVNDNIILGLLNGFLSKKAQWFYDRNDIERVILNSDLLISSRYHSSLFALKAGIPFIDITHHSKNSNFLKDVKLEEFSISYWNLELNSLTEKYKNAIDSPKFLQAQHDYGVLTDESWKKVNQSIKKLINEQI